MNSQVEVAVNWPAFLAQQDPIWERLPETWMDGAFVGNGRLGAMIYKGHGESEPGADVLAWTLGRSDLYDDRDTGDAWLNSGQRSGFDMGGNCRLPIGRFHICPVGEVRNGTIRIDLWNGEARGEITTDRGSICWRSWVQDPSGGIFSPADNRHPHSALGSQRNDADSGVVAIELETGGSEEEASWKWQPFRSMCPRYHTRPMEGYEPNPEARQQKVGDANVRVQPLLAGGYYSTAWLERPLGRGKRVLYIAVAPDERELRELEDPNIPFSQPSHGMLVTDLVSHLVSHLVDSTSMPGRGARQGARQGLFW